MSDVYKFEADNPEISVNNNGLFRFGHDSARSYGNKLLRPHRDLVNAATTTPFKRPPVPPSQPLCQAFEREEFVGLWSSNGVVCKKSIRFHSLSVFSTLSKIFP